MEFIRKRKRRLELHRFYERNFDSLYKFFLYKTQNRTIAEELTSETFLTFANEFASGKEIENKRAFLYGIARNHFNAYLRHKYQTVELEIDEFNFFDFADSFIEEYEKPEYLEERIKKYIEELPKKQKLVIELRVIQKLTLKEIAKKVGKNMNYVKVNQRRAIKSLKKLIEKDNSVHQSAHNNKDE